MIRVAIIEDQREIREGLKELIDGAEGFRCSAVFRLGGGSVAEDRKRPCRMWCWWISGCRANPESKVSGC